MSGSVRNLRGKFTPPGAALSPALSTALAFGGVIFAFAVTVTAIVGCTGAWIAYGEVRSLAAKQADVPEYLSVCPTTSCLSGDFYTYMDGCLRCVPTPGVVNGSLDTIGSAGPDQSLVFDGIGTTKSLMSLGASGAASASNPGGTSVIVHVEPVTIASTGSGVALLTDNAGPSFAVATLAGAGISSVSSNGATVTVTTPNPTLGSAGGTSWIKNSASRQLYGFLFGENLVTTLVSDSYYLIDSPTQQVTSVGGLSLVANSVSRTFYGLEAGENVNISLSAGSRYRIDASAPPVTAASGAVTPTAKSLVVDGTIKYMDAGGDLAVTQTANTVTIEGYTPFVEYGGGNSVGNIVVTSGLEVSSLTSPVKGGQFFRTSLFWIEITFDPLFTGSPLAQLVFLPIPLLYSPGLGGHTSGTVTCYKDPEPSFFGYVYAQDVFSGSIGNSVETPSAYVMYLMVPTQPQDISYTCRGTYTQYIV